ncbi:MAG: hypothetical protein KDG55_01155 [Rhodocyclaceae bacterium]|nr:hypothetical protein [Rhodocyclaceae bacterium]
MLSLSAACNRGMAFGTDIAFTYGPFGCLINRQFWPGQYGSAVVFCALFGALAGLLATYGRAPRTWRFLALVWAGATATMMPDAALLALPLALIWHADQRGALALHALGVAALGVLALTKFTLLPLGLSAVVAAAVIRAEHGRRPWVVAALADLCLYGLALLTAWLAAGQALTALPDYLALGLEVSRGYAEAMAWREPDEPRRRMAIVVAAIMALTAVLMIRRPVGRERAARIAWSCFALAWLALGYRHALVRADEWHLAMGATMAGMLLLGRVAELSGHARWLAGVLGLASLGTCVVLAHSAGQWAAPLRHARQNLEWLMSPVATEAQLAQAWRVQAHQLRTDFSRFADLPGTYDILGHDQHLMRVAGLDRWQPRPVFQSYSVYTPRLAALNAAHLESEGGPRYLIVRPTSIDGRLPSLDDAGIWPLLPRLYETEARLGPALLLRRRNAAALPAPSGAPVNWSATGWSALPAVDGKQCFLRAAVQRSPGARLRGLLWRPGAIYLELRSVASQRHWRFRLVPAIAAQGFLLWPLVIDADGLAHWLDGTQGPVPADLELRLLDEDGGVLSASLALSGAPFDSPRP